MARDHSHYFKNVDKLCEVDVYRVCDLFGVNDPSGATQHAIKKLLLPGGRGGGKTVAQDIKEARDTLNRRLAMLEEDAAIARAAEAAGRGEIGENLLDADPKVVKEITDSVAHLVGPAEARLADKPLEQPVCASGIRDTSITDQFTPSAFLFRNGKVLFGPDMYQAKYRQTVRISGKNRDAIDKLDPHAVVVVCSFHDVVNLWPAGEVHWPSVKWWRLATREEGAWVPHTSGVRPGELGNGSQVVIIGRGHTIPVPSGSAGGLSWSREIPVPIEGWRYRDSKLIHD